MKLKTWTLYLFSSICFAFIGIMKLIDKKYLIGFTFICLGLSYATLSMTHYKKSNKPNKNDLSDEELENMNIELRNLIKENKKVEAVKKCRIVTGFGLKEAKQYVDSLNEQNK